MADDVIIQAQDTTMERNGTTLQSRYRQLPSGAVMYYPLIPGGVSDAVLTFLASLINQDRQCLPGGLTLLDIQSIVPELFNGAAELQLIYQQNPFSTEYELATADRYNEQYATARAAAMSGPTNVRGGTARQGFELAELDTLQAINRFREIWQNQLALAQIVATAVQIANAIEDSRRRTMLQAQQQQAGTEQCRAVQALSACEGVSRIQNDSIRGFGTFADFTGQEFIQTDENMFGRGAQGVVSSAIGASYWR